MFRPSASLTRVLASCLALSFALNIARAQTATPAASGTFDYKADKISIRNNGVRLDGNAQITSPQLEVRATAIAFDFAESQITAVRARGNVNIKVNLVPKGGGVPTRIEATASEADLNPPTRTLVLRGNVDGFYQLGSGPRTTLAGSEATMTYVGGRPSVKLKGPVSLIVPPEPDSAAALGTVKITSRDADFDDKTGEVRFVGDARAVSTDGPNRFDVAAPTLVLTRGEGNTIDTLKTVGRTRVKIDLPPEPAKPAGEGNGNSKIGRPTAVEVEADSAVVNRATNTLVFDGNVKGFYQLSPAEGAPQKYDFSGTKATLKYVPEAQATAENPAGLKADIIGAPGKPVEVKTPLFNLDLGG